MPRPAWAAEGRGAGRVALSARRSPRAPALVKILRFPCCHFSFAPRLLCWEKGLRRARLPTRGRPPPSPPPRGMKSHRHPETRSPARRVCAGRRCRYREGSPRNRIASPPFPRLSPSVHSVQLRGFPEVFPSPATRSIVLRAGFKKIN